MPLPLSAFQMVCICVLTDIGPAMSLILEKPEKVVLKRPPRSKKDLLINWKLIGHAFLFIGLMQTFFSHLSFLLYLKWYGSFDANQVFFTFINWGSHLNYSRKQLDEFLYTGQTVTFTSLVIMQVFGHIFCTRTNFKSCFQKPSLYWRNPQILWMFASQLVAILLLILIVFLPFINSLFNTRQIPVEFFFIPLIYCVIIFMADELRKMFVRKEMFCFSRIAW